MFDTIVCILVLTKLTESAVFTSNETTWEKARNKCLEQGRQLTGATVFYSNVTRQYDPNSILSFISSNTNAFPVWIYAYRQLTIWISQDGCWNIVEDALNEIEHTFTLPLNGPGECVIKCENKFPGNRGFALLNDKCYCLSRTDRNKVRRNAVSFGTCKIRCSGGSNYYCGGSNPQSNYSTNRLISLYKKISISQTFFEGQNCITKIDQKEFTANNCEDTYSCICTNLRETIYVSHTSVTWNECNTKCRDFGYQVAVIDLITNKNLTMEANVSYWSGYFRLEHLIWDKKNDNPHDSTKCLTLNKINEQNFTFQSQDCDQRYPALCYNSSNGSSSSRNPTVTRTEQTLETSSIYNSSTSGYVTRPLSGKDNDFPIMELIIGVTAGGVALLITIIIVVCVYKRRRSAGGVDKQVSKIRKDSSVPNAYSQPLNENDFELQRIKPLLQNQSTKDNEYYDHLHSKRDASNPGTGNIYDHTHADAYDVAIGHEKAGKTASLDNNEYDTFGRDSKYDAYDSVNHKKDNEIVNSVKDVENEYSHV